MSAKDSLKKVITALGKKDRIVFESVPDLSDNTYCVFEELHKRGYDKKYEFVWLVQNKKLCLEKTRSNSLFENTRFFERKSRLDALFFRWLCIRSKCLICCNEFLTCFDNNQKSFFLTHGTGIKKLHNYTMPDKVDFCITASKTLESMTARELNCSIDKLITLGAPRNDILKTDRVDLKKLLGEHKKYVCWYPTFRQQKRHNVQDVGEHAFPIIHDEKKATLLNDYAKERDVLIVVKPHYAQNVDYIKDLGLSHIKMIDDDFFTENDVSSYAFLASCDSMITDYSSVFFDFILCDKPVSVVWEDIEDYRKYPGFSLDVDEYMKCALKIYTLDDFYKFIDEIAEGKDSLKEERHEINKKVNTFDDSNSTQRVTDFIVKECNL